MREDIMQVDTVTLDDEKNALVIIDQTLLPGEVRMLSLTRQEDIREAIYMLRVRGAPAIRAADGGKPVLGAGQDGACCACKPRQNG